MNAIPQRFPVKLKTRGTSVDMSHGAGGRAMAQLIEDLFIRHFDNPLLREQNDQAAFDDLGITGHDWNTGRLGRGRHAGNDALQVREWKALF